MESNKAMLYLFNSGYRPKYVRNVLNTLYSPTGGTNEYRYRYHHSPVSTGAVNINPADLGKFKDTRRNTPAVIIFVDRFKNGGYFYHPIRMANFINYREDNDYSFFRVKLSEYVYPRNIDSFNRMFVRHMHSKNIVQLTNDDPLNTDDGWYAINDDNLFSLQDDFYWGNPAWTTCVDNLKTCEAFKSRGVVNDDKGQIVERGREFVFVRCNLSSSKGKAVLPKLIDDSAYYELTTGRRYRLNLSYKYPIQEIDRSKKSLVTVETHENLKMYGSSEINIESYSDGRQLPFATNRYLAEHSDSITIKFSTSDENCDVEGTDSELHMKIREPRTFWVQLIFALLVFSALSVYQGADMSKICPLTFNTVIDALWHKGLAALVQTSVLFWMFRLIGKRFI